MSAPLGAVVNVYARLFKRRYHLLKKADEHEPYPVCVNGSAQSPWNFDAVFLRHPGVARLFFFPGRVFAVGKALRAVGQVLAYEAMEEAPSAAARVVHMCATEAPDEITSPPKSCATTHESRGKPALPITALGPGQVPTI